MKKFIGILLLVGVLFVACDNGSTGTTKSKLEIIDIANATSLFIAPGSNSRSINGRAVGDANKLFKITDDGYVQEVSYFDEDGNESTIINDINEPVAIYDVNNDYIIICFGFDTINITDGYLVRKTDGAVFSLNNVGFPSSFPSNNYANSKIVQSDSLGNIFYVVQNENNNIDLIKIDASNPNNLTKIVWIEDRAYISQICVSPAGHIIYYAQFAGNAGEEKRIKKANGGLINLPQTTYAWWIGLDNNIKYFNNKSEIWNVSIDTNFQETMSSIFCPYIIGFDNQSYLLRFDDIIILTRGTGIYEIENPSNTPREILISEITTIKKAAYSNDYYYLSGNDASNQPVLLKVNPKTDVVKTLLPPNQYDIYKMTVDNNNVISFNAERMSDGVKVVGQVSSNGIVSILDEKMNTEIVILERIK
jgi:dipeptidyl aminopeptidase/acylaminoacyl peptidase